MPGGVFAAKFAAYGSDGTEGEASLLAGAVAGLVATEQLNLTAFVSHRFALREIDRAFAVQADVATSLKVLVLP